MGGTSRVQAWPMPANFVVEDQPPTDPDKLEAWVREQDIDWIDVDLSEI